MKRIIVLDTETTGLEPSTGHRIIEIGAVEVINRRLTGNHYHQYLQPDRDSDAGALAVHGITAEFLADKPRFADIVDQFLAFIDGAELVIHNAPFDIGFLNNELNLWDADAALIAERCQITDSLIMARQRHPGQRNSLDALCGRYYVNNEQRTLHGALLDSEILADVYLAMTGGQVSLLQSNQGADQSEQQTQMLTEISADRPRLPTPQPTDSELADHQAYLTLLDKKTDGHCVWSTR